MAPVTDRRRGIAANWIRVSGASPIAAFPWDSDQEKAQLR